MSYFEADGAGDRVPVLVPVGALASSVGFGAVPTDVSFRLAFRCCVFDAYLLTFVASSGLLEVLPRFYSFPFDVESVGDCCVGCLLRREVDEY